MFRKSYGQVFDGDDNWTSLDVPTGDRFAWDAGLDLRAQAAVLRGHAARARAGAATSSARACWPCSATASRPTTSRRPARSRRTARPARYLQEHGVAPRDFNSYGSRRGNHEVMVRGTFANIRLRNLLAPGTEGGVTRHLPSGEQMSIYDACDALPERGRAAGRARRQGVRLRLVARLGGEGHEPARRARRDRGELRAHPPLEPRRHGRAAAAVRRGPERRVARPHRQGDLRDHGLRRAAQRRRAAAPRDGQRGQRRVPGRRADRHAEGGRLLPPRRDPARTCCASWPPCSVAAMQIRAAVLEEFGKPLVVREVGLDGPQAGEVLVRVRPAASATPTCTPPAASTPRATRRPCSATRARASSRRSARA